MQTQGGEVSRVRQGLCWWCKCPTCLSGIGGQRALSLLQQEASCNCSRPRQGNQQLLRLAKHAQVLSVINHKTLALLVLCSVCLPCQHHSLTPLRVSQL